MANPALRQRGQDVLIVNFDGTSATVKGTVRNFETTASEANLPFADAGPICWIDYSGDGQQIEFVEYLDEATGNRVHRRKIKAEIVGTMFAVMKLNLSKDAITLPGGDFSAAEFSAADFNVG